MKVLVACEFSGIVREAFKKVGHDAWSCDILETEIPGNHIQGDVLNHLNEGWDLMIAHPPCTYLSSAGARHWKNPRRKEKQLEAAQFFLKLVNAPIEKICIENPTGFMNTYYKKPTQIVHPYYFGDPYQKRTCLWLKKLPKLFYLNTKIMKPKPLYKCQGEKCRNKLINWCEGIKNVKDRSKARSRTFPGIAKAMAEQWGNCGIRKTIE